MQSSFFHEKHTGVICDLASEQPTWAQLLSQPGDNADLTLRLLNHDNKNSNDSSSSSRRVLKLVSQLALPVSNENTDRARILTALGFLFNLRSILWLERQEKRPCQYLTQHQSYCTGHS